MDDHFHDDSLQTLDCFFYHVPQGAHWLCPATLNYCFREDSLPTLEYHLSQVPLRGHWLSEDPLSCFRSRGHFLSGRRFREDSLANPQQQKMQHPSSEDWCSRRSLLGWVWVRRNVVLRIYAKSISRFYAHNLLSLHGDDRTGKLSTRVFSNCRCSQIECRLLRRSHEFRVGSPSGIYCL